jgi:hypothetical protein
MKFEPLPKGNYALLPASHAAWDAHAVHGMHAMYSVGTWVQPGAMGSPARVKADRSHVRKLSVDAATMNS